MDWRHVPSLAGLRAFEAAARHLSLQKAAEELHVTPAALSHQIKSLEEHLGQPLFRRLNRAVELTEAGHALSPGTTDAFSTLITAWRNAQRVTEDDVLNVTAGPAFTAKWLAPRLYEFATSHPHIELRFSASVKRLDFQRDNIDVAIRFGTGVNDDLYSLPLAEEWTTPVMLPEMAGRYPTAESLLDAPLIHDASIDFMNLPSSWPAWFGMLGINDVPSPHLTFNQAAHAVDAALAGGGVALGRRSLVVKDIAEGRLVAPFKTALATGAQFRFLCASGTESRPQIVTFRDWMLAEIAKNAHVTEAMTVVSLT